MSSRKNQDLQPDIRRARAFLEGANAGTWIWDLTTHETRYDERWASIIGYTVSELGPTTHHTWLALTHPDDRTAAVQQGKACIEGKVERYDVEYRMRHRDGRWIWVHDRGRITAWDAHGHATEFCGTHVDITHRKEREQQLHVLSVVARQTTDVVIVTDGMGRIEWVNAAFTRFTGYRLEEVYGRKPGSVLQGPGTDRDTILRISAHLAARRAFVEEILNYRKDGTPCWVRLAVDPMLNEYQEFSGFIGVQSDITERRRAEEQLRYREALLAQAGRLARVGAWELDCKTLQGWYSDDVADMLQIERGSAISLAEGVALGASDQAQPMLDDMLACVRDGRPVDRTTRVMLANRSFWLRVVGERTADKARVVGALMDVTEQREAAEALRESRELLSEAGALAQVGAWEFDLVTHQNRWSEVTYAIYGLSPHESVSSDLALQAYDPRAQERLQEACRACIATGEPFDLVLPFRAHQDDPRWLRIVGRRRTRDGVATQLYGAVLDVTEQRRAEDLLRAREELLEQTGQVAGVGGWEFDPVTERCSWTAAMRRIHAVPDDWTVTLEGALGFFDQHATPAVREAFDRCLKAGTPFDLEARIVTFNQRKRWVRFVGRRSDSRGVLYGALQDVTEQQKAAEELRKSHERFRLAAEGSHDGVWDWDLRLGEMYLSPRWKALLGYQDHEVPSLWSTFEDHLHPEDRPRVMREIGDYLGDRNSVWRSEFRMIDRHGDLRVIYARGAALRTPEGRPYRFAGSMSDVTQEKARAAEREQIGARLAQHEKFESLGRLAGGVAHDFNNMLTVILGHARELRDATPPGSATYASLTELLGAAERSADLTRQLLAFSRKQPTVHKAVDLRVALRNILTLLRRVVPQSVELSLNVDEDVPTLQLDAGQIDQMVTNLVLNARDACASHIVLSLRKGARSNDGHGRVCISVRDDGVGMGQDTLERIFEPFYTTKELGRGTGLGLANVRAAAHAHGGTIEVRSTPGRGSVFEVWLPVVPSVAEEVRTPRPTAPVSLRAVVIDDEPAIARIASRMLEAMGARVATFHSAEAAWSHLQDGADDLDLLVTDVMLPGMTGPELAARLRERRPRLRVVLMSGYTDGPAPDLETSGQIWLPKPFSREDLAVAVETAVKN
jgi:PAS domain S-box-containing protein